MKWYRIIIAWIFIAAVVTVAAVAQRPGPSETSRVTQVPCRVVLPYDNTFVCRCGLSQDFVVRCSIMPAALVNMMDSMRLRRDSMRPMRMDSMVMRMKRDSAAVKTDSNRTIRRMPRRP